MDCAVSGGADSLALLMLATEAGLEVTAWHVDHGLRPGSPTEADVVRRAADRFGAGFRGLTATVAPGPNLEARARRARYEVLPAGVLTGHTADDQAETVLLNVLRGSGIDGMAGIRPGPTKPLLALRRHETAHLCEALGLVPVVDESNLDPVHRRNRVRHELLPLMDDIADRDVAALLVRQADVMGDDVDLLDRLADGIDATDAKSLKVVPRPLARRAVRRWLVSALALEHPPDLAAVDRVLAVAHGEAVACEVTGGWRVERSGMRLRVRPTKPT